MGGIIQTPQKAFRPRQQFVGTHGRAMIALAGGAGDSNWTRGESRVAMKTGPAEVTDLQLLYCNYYLSPTGNVGFETDNPNTIQIEAALEVASPNVYYPALFGNQKRPTLDAGSYMVLSDPIGIDVPANSLLYARTGVIVASGQQWPSGVNVLGLGDEGYARSTSATSQVYAVGTMGVPSGGIFGNSLFPLALVGTPKTPMPSIIILGDSIAHGSGESSSTTGHVSGGAGGFIARGLENVNGAGNMLPYTNVSCPGMGTAGYIGSAGYRRLALARFATHAIVQVCNNDIAATALATTQSNLTATWTALKRRGVKVYQCLPTPRTTDATNTTIVTNYGPGQVRSQLITWIKAQVGLGLLDGVIDPNIYVESQTSPGFWKSAATTSDGTHPTTQGHIDASAAVQAWAQSISVNAITGLAA